MFPVIVTQEQLDALNKPMHDISRKAHANDVPARRDEVTIQAEIDRLVSARENAERQLTKFAGQFNTLTESLKRYKLALGYWTDPKEKHNPVEARNALRELNGFNYYSKGYDRHEHQDGLIEATEKKLAETEKLVKRYSAAVENTERNLQEHGPRLKKELLDAQRHAKRSRF
jgi:hypothetical protein